MKKNKHKNKKMKEFVITQARPSTPASLPKSATDRVKEHFLHKAEQQLDAFLKSDKKIVFPFFEHPEVSIVVVTYTQTALELLCFMSISRWVRGCSYEVVISNNGISERNKELLDRLENVKIINNEENKGFVAGVNIGADYASGEYILLLNDDALVTYDCVQSLLKRIRQWKRTKVGVVGAQIRRLDNTVQDAGGILWSDGEAAEYSKGRNPDIGDVNFVRGVDYVSGSCFMTPRELFLGLNKFDEVYSPGYCEESDYCLRVRKEGYKVIYDPSAKVLHYEYGSSDPTKVSNLVEEHTEILRTKHKDILAQGYHKSTPPAYARTNKRYRGRVLIIDDFVPRPNYGDNALIDYIKALVDNDFFVTFFPLHVGVDDWMSVYDWVPDTVEVMLYESEGDLGKILSERPRFYDYFVSKTYDLYNLVKTGATEGKYVIQLGDQDDFDCPLLAEIIKPTALWVDWHIPEYDTNAGDYAVYSYCSMLQELGFKIRYWSDDSRWQAQDIKYAKTLLQNKWEICNLAGFTFEQTISDLGHTVDLVVLARPLAINYIKQIREWTRAPIIYYCHDLHYLRESRRLSQQENGISDTDRLSLGALKRTEFDIIEKIDLFVTVSQFEKEEINGEIPGTRVSVWPWYCPPNPPPDSNREFKFRNQIIFIGGMQHTPNQDAIRWFTSEVFPLVKKEVPDAVLTVIGDKAPEDIISLHDDKNICVKGHVEDLTTFLHYSSLLVAPIRFGAGFKGKIAMAMSHGLPVATTTIGAEGIGLTDGENVLIGDTREQFAKNVINILNDHNLQKELSLNSLKYSEEHWSAEVVNKHLRNDIDSLNTKGVVA
jgi:GT2 family glycosyltransferase/glycosyltransferase involved in cell wall biosynthesis